MKRVIAILLFVLFCLTLLTACGKKAEEPVEPTAAPTAEPAAKPTPTPAPTPEPTPEVTSEPSPEPAPINPLTGEPLAAELAAQRPIAVMINNHEDAQPQCGISEASIIYEIPVEGWITRMIGIFQDYS